MMEKIREVPKKNYLILGIIIIVSLFILYYFYMWMNAYNDSKLNVPILDSYMTRINYNELDDFLVENPNSIIYVSVLENKEIREFEKKFKVLFKNKKLKYNILYMDITDDIDNLDILHDMDMKYSINSFSIYNVPSIMVIDNGNVKSIYNIKENGYDVNKIKEYINNITFMDEEM